MIVIGIGEFAATAQSGKVLSTRLLGSRIAVLCHCPRTGAVGMLHVAFPRSSVDPVQATVLPGIYADTGVRALLRQVQPLCGEAFAEVSVVLVGGGESEEGQHGSLAAENAKAVAQALAGFGLKSGFEFSGGGYCSTVTLEAGTGRVRMTTANVSSNVPAEKR